MPGHVALPYELRIILTLLGSVVTMGCTGLIGEPTGNGPNRPGTPADPRRPGPQVPVDDENLETGLDFWNARCAGCHGNFSTGSAVSTGDDNGDFRLDAEAAVLRRGAELEQYIDATMPFQTAALCQGDCAQATGALIRSRVQPKLPTNCDAANSTTYGLRELKLLTSREYQRSLEDLLGVTGSFGTTVANNDAALGGFVNMRGKGVNSATLESYVANAANIATWAVSEGRPFTCDQPASCAQRFVDEFLFEAFRGPVSDEQKAQFVALFSDYPGQGMQLALEAALTSPYFLYRIEAGVDLETALSRGYYTNTADPTEPSGNATEVVSASSFPIGTGRLEGDVWALTENGGVELPFTTPFTDPTTIEVIARGSNHDAIWPELTVVLNGHRIGTQLVDSPQLTTYRFVVEGQVGVRRIRLEFNNDSGVPPYGPGQDANLYIASVGIVTGTTPSPPPPPATGVATALEGVDDTAFVVTPYELAAALSFMLTGSTPDRTLLAAAQADQLTTPQQIEAQVVRLIDSPRGREHVADFVNQWFHLDAVLGATRPDVPEFTPAVKASMVQEVQEHFAHVFYEDDAPYSDFFGGNYTFLNRTLADFYGVQGNFNNDFTAVEVEGRGGPIASGAFMAANAHVQRTAPILRAVHSRQAALCHYIDPPNSPIAGDDIDEQRAAAQMRVTEREEQEGALSSRDFYFLYTDGIEACAGCHERIINPMFGLEDFDNVGRLRDTAGADTVLELINGIETPVSLQGELHGIDSTSDPTSISYAGAKDFSNKIAETEAVKACLVRRGFRYVTGLTFNDRDLDTSKREELTEEQRRDYACIASRMTDALKQNGESPRAMFIELATESLLRLRR